MGKIASSEPTVLYVTDDGGRVHELRPGVPEKDVPHLTLDGTPMLPVRNPSGINPTEFRVLIKPKMVEEKTKGGIIIPDQIKEQEQFAQQEGELVAVSPHAFTYATWANGDMPKPGDTVLFAKYAGATVKGKDGAEYRLVNDKDISAVLV